ncbi:MAG: hypothetical protein HS126_18890 [Anaerolineales bacterium]|nr:hypothetical protein [Anaerolineales bacterium]
MKELPPGLEKFEAYLSNLPVPDNAIFMYRLCMMMRSVGKMKIVDVVPANDWEMIFFETTAGFEFHTIWPYLDRVTHLEILKRIKPLLDEAEKIVAER